MTLNTQWCTRPLSASLFSGLHVEDVTEYQMKVGHEIKKWIKFQCCESNFLMIVLTYNTDEMI